MIKHLVIIFATGALLLGANGASVIYQHPHIVQEDGIRGYSKDFPCPPASQIVPCSCMVADNKMTMDCSTVESGAQLQAIFHSTPPFPFTHFTKFTMKSNKNLEALENGIFNKITFDEIEITGSALSEIQEGSVEESASTLKKLTLHGNQIVRFLMNDNPDMSMFTELKHLDLGTNLILVFPDITSTTLTELLVNNNPIHTIHDENLKGVPNLEKIDMSEIGMETLETKILTNHTKLQQVLLKHNSVTDVEGTTLKIESPDMILIDLSDNLISDVEPDAFDQEYISGVTINLSGNQLVYLDEATWKPLIKNGAFLNFANNPLQCGCDIKWIMVPEDGDNTDYIGAIHEGTCPQDGGTEISDLEPDWYENFCQ